MQRKDIIRLIATIGSEEDLFNGNCATFAVALYRYLNEQGVPTGLIYCGNNEEDGTCHAAVTLGKTILDGSGVISRKQLKQYGLYAHYSKLSDVWVKEYPPGVPDEGDLTCIWAKTEYDVTEPEFYRRIGARLRSAAN